MNGRDDWGRSGRRGRSPTGGIGVDPLLDRAIRLVRELFSVLQRAEAGVDDAARDLRRAREVHRGAEARERREEAIERDAERDLTGGRDRDDRGRSGRYYRGRSGRRGDWRTP